jgi:probable HAF family extracellular repeat protein
VRDGRDANVRTSQYTQRQGARRTAASAGASIRPARSAGSGAGVFAHSSGKTHGFLFPNPIFGPHYLTLDDPLATNVTGASGINDAGQIVGNYTDASGIHGFLYNGGSYSTFDDPFAPTGTRAQGINGSGQIVGWYSNASGSNAHGFLLTITPNPPPPAGTTADMILRRADGTYDGRASELMQIADGRKSTQEIRAGKAESVARLRARGSSLQAQCSEEDHHGLPDEGLLGLHQPPSDKSSRLIDALAGSDAETRGAAVEALIGGSRQTDFEPVTRAVADLDSRLARAGR